MLLIAKKPGEINFSKLMGVYQESNLENSAICFPQMPTEEALREVERQFCEYLLDDFFQIPGAFYGVLTQNGQYVSALRVEPYQDGMLLEALETAPQYRGQGCATKLMEEIKAIVPENIYSHVGKRNTASLQTHKKCGFEVISDCATYIDGSVASNAYTLCLKR